MHRYMVEKAFPAVAIILAVAVALLRPTPAAGAYGTARTSHTPAADAAAARRLSPTRASAVQQPYVRLMTRRPGGAGIWSATRSGRKPAIPEPLVTRQRLTTRGSRSLAAPLRTLYTTPFGLQLARSHGVTRARLGPHAACATHVWEILENLPFLNRYDNFVDDGQGNCILYSTDVEDTTIDGSIQLPVPNSQSTLAEAQVIVDGTLDVAPSDLAMAPAAEIDVAAGGTLNMSDVTVASASGSPQQGDWRGIAFWSGSTGSLDSVTVAGGGAGVRENPTGLCCAGAAIYVGAGANPTITNSTVDLSSGHGFEIDGSGTPTPAFSGDSVTNSGQNSYFYAVYYDNTPDVIGVNNVAASNDVHDSVRLPGGMLTGTLTLVNPGIPVQLDGTITVGNGGALGVAQGAQMLFNFGGITISGGGTMSVGAGALFQSTSAGRQNAIYVDGGGTLQMAGTAASPIVLTSANATPHPGDWPGIAFWPGGGGSLDHVQVSYAGSGSALDSNLAHCCANAGIYVNSGANPSITNTTVDHSSGNGFELDGQDLTAFSGDSATKNGGFAVYYDHTPDRTGANLFSGGGNAHDSVRIPGGTVSGQLTLAAPGLPAQVDGTLTVTSTAAMTADDVALLFTGGGIVVSGGGQVNLVNSTQVQFAPGNGAASAIYVDAGGTLTMAFGIVLTSAAATPHPGDWGGVVFWPGGRGALYGVQIDYAGGSTNPDPSRQSFIHAGFYANQGAVTSVSQTTVDHSSGEGFELDGRNIFTEAARLFGGDGATNNGDFAVYYDHTPSFRFANGFSGGGNVHDAVRIPSGTITGTLTLLYPGLPAQIDGTLTVTRGATLALGSLIPGHQNVLFTSGGASEGIVVSGGHMIVGAGAQMQFTLGHIAAIYVDNGGTLDMTGTATSPISLTSASATPHPADWAGIAFWPGSTGHLSYVHESFAGFGLYADPSRSTTVSAGLYVDNGATPSIVNTTVDYSLVNGFEIDGRGAATFSGDTANNNGSGDGGYAVYYDHTPSVAGVNLFAASGNGHDVVRLPGGTVTGALSLGAATAAGLPTQIDGMLVITAGASLTINRNQQVVFATSNFGGVTVSGGAHATIAAGTRVQFEQGRAGTIYVDNGGTLTMAGTTTRPISLTSTNAAPQPGDWGGIAFWPGSSGSLSHVHLSGAGFGVDDTPTHCCVYTSIYVNASAPSILDSAVDTSETDDVEIGHGGLPVLRGDSFGAVSGSSYLGVINDNGAAGPTVDATYDWWGSPSGPSGAGPGTGVAVSAGVNFTPWLGAPPTAAAIVRSPCCGSFGSAIAITGTGFGPAEPVVVYWDSAATAPLSTTTADASGSFVVTVTVPQTPLGVHGIVVIGRDSGLIATAAFTARPREFLSATSLVPTERVVAAGTNFAAHETVKTYWNNTGAGGILLGTATTNALGTFAGAQAVTFTVPLSPTGTYRVISIGQSSGGVYTATVQLGAAPRINPTSGAPGASLLVVGDEVGLRVEGLGAVRGDGRVAAVGVEFTRVGGVALVDGQNVQQAAAHLRVFRREQCLHAPVEVARHQVGAAQVERLVAAVGEVVEAAVLQEAPHQ